MNIICICCVIQVMHKKILTIGDSHSSDVHSHWGKINIEGLEIIAGHIGPKLAYTLGRGAISDMVIQQINNAKLKKDDLIIFCMGEIDCRCHVSDKSKGKDWRQVIREIVFPYLKKIKELTNNFSEVYVYNVTPTRNTPEQEVGEFPFRGEPQERREYTLYMNKIIMENCEKFGSKFFDIYSSIVCPEGFLNLSQADASIHVVDPLPAQEFLLKNVLI